MFYLYTDRNTDANSKRDNKERKKRKKKEIEKRNRKRIEKIEESGKICKCAFVI